MSNPFILFNIVWFSALGGACISEYVRRRWESRRTTSRWQSRQYRAGR